MDPWRATEEFGREIGLAGLTLDSGQASFELESGVGLGLLLRDRDLLVHVRQPVPHPDASLSLRALQSAEARDRRGFALQVGSRGSGSDFCLVGAVRLIESQLSSESLMKAAEQLLSWADSLSPPV
jgi:type III secretion system chaperone SycN